MTKIARLTHETTIERDEQGVAWIVTSDDCVAASWLYFDGAQTWWVPPGMGDADGVWTNDIGAVGLYELYRIPLLTAHLEVYQYRGEGHWWAIAHNGVCTTGDTDVAWPTCEILTLDGAKLCGGSADALRRYLEIVQGEIDE
jgi:hypothetical protein